MRHHAGGALVPGSTLLSYMLEMLYNAFKEKWLNKGKIKVSFIGGGTLNGDLVTVHGKAKLIETQEAGDWFTPDLWMENQDGVKIMVGEASCLR